MEVFSGVGDAAIKPTVGSSSGKNVRLICMQEGVDKKTGETATSILAQYGKNFIVQERIRPHPAFAALYARAINTLRIITYIAGDQVCIAPMALRLGTGGNEVDNIHAGGLVVGVGETGQCKPKAYQLGYGDKNITFERHPDTNTLFDGYQIPYIQEIRSAVKNLHLRTPNIGMISWDITLNDQNEILVVEANYKSQSLWFPQIADGESFFGNQTAEMLKMIRK